MDLHVGTSGYSYKEWKGSFYPEDLKAADMLSFYATKLAAVEINNTFYRLPKASVLEGWASQVPASFRFSIKASRRITHMKRLKDAAEETDYLMETVQTLGPRLGVVLFQLPPNLKLDLDRLRSFLDVLAGHDARSVFEFRHESWADDAVHELLRERGAALCVSDVDDADPPALVPTADIVYLRLRRMDYDTDDLARWAGEVTATGAQQAYVFFKHEDDGAGPALAARFIDAAGG